MMQKSSLAFAALSALLALPGAAAAQDAASAAPQTVRIATEGAYAPWNFMNAEGEPAGYEIDLAAAICAEADLDCEIVLNDWDSIIPNLLAGNYDLIMAGMSITDERLETIDFTDNYFPPDPSRFIAAPGAAFDFDAISGARVGVQSSTIQAAYAEANLADDNTIVSFATADQAMADLAAGNLDTILADENYLQPIVDGAGGALEFAGEGILIGAGVGAGLRKDEPELLAAVDAAITALKADGTVDALIAQWFEGAGPFFSEEAAQ